MPTLFSHSEVKLFADKLNNSPAKDLRYIYNQIYAIHHGVQGKVSYTFSPEAEKLFNDHTFSTIAAANAVFNGESQEFINSKDEKHIIRLSCIIHVKRSIQQCIGDKRTVRGECSMGRYRRGERSRGECSTNKYHKGECSSH